MHVDNQLAIRRLHRCVYVAVLSSMIGKKRTLSFGGRFTLIKSVIGSLPTYYLSIFRAPKKVLDELEKIRRNFLWKGLPDKKCIHWVTWDKVTTLKEMGGLGVVGLNEFNISLLAKRW